MHMHGNTNSNFLKNLPPPPASEAVNVSTSNILMWEVLIWADLHLGIPEQMSLEVPGDDPLIRVENFSFFSPPLSTAFTLNPILRRPRRALLHRLLR